MKHLKTLMTLSILFYMAGNSVAAPVFTFTSPDAPLDGSYVSGLCGKLWSDPAIAPVDTLAQARTYIGAHGPDSFFRASVVDYPNGAAGSTGTSTKIKDALGAVDAATLSHPAVGENAVLNSIIQLNGYLKIASAKTTLNLGLGSDDGSELFIQGTQVISNDGLHPFGGPAPKEILFTQAGLYSMELLFFESQVVEWGLEFSNGALGSGNPVPNDMLRSSTCAVPAPGAFLLTGLGTGLVGYMRRRRSL